MYDTPHLPNVPEALSMRTSTPIVSSLVAATLALAPVHDALAAPKADDAAADETAEDAPEDEEAEGEEPSDEEAAEGEAAEGEEGEPAEGELTEEEAEAAAAAEAEAAAAAEAEAAKSDSSYLPEEDDRPPEPRIANKPAKGKGMMIAGGSAAGAGLAMTITFGLMTRHCSIDGPLQCRLQNQDDFLIPMGVATLLTGTMLLAVGVGYHLRYKKWERWTPEGDKKTALIPTPAAFRGGGGLVWSGRF
ncbi:MAG: hypothetical protein KC501_07185 [Myxococcales bacterium]|nr:hypothetical protein [Myxococcales bacterium]